MLHDEVNESVSSNQTNTAIGIKNKISYYIIIINFIYFKYILGIVIPTQPTQQSAEGLTGYSTLSRSRDPHNIPINSQRANSLNNPSRTNVEDKMNQIQEYIKITSSLLNSMQLDDVVSSL